MLALRTGGGRLFELEPGVWACKWQGGCDHRVMQQEARMAELVRRMADLDRLGTNR